jgi:hypothetical protein
VQGMLLGGLEACCVSDTGGKVGMFGFG